MNWSPSSSSTLPDHLKRNATGLTQYLRQKLLAPQRVNVYEIMSKPVLTVPTEMLARYAVRMLVRFAISRALVVDQQRNPLGMVTLRDLVIGLAPG